MQVLQIHHQLQSDHIHANLKKKKQSKKELNLYHTLHFIDTDLLTSKLILICYVNGLYVYFRYWTETSL